MTSPTFSNDTQSAIATPPPAVKVEAQQTPANRIDAKDGSQAVISAIDSITEPSAAALVPALAPQHNIEHTLWSNWFDNLAYNAPVALFLAPDLAQHVLRISIVDAASLGFIACDVPIFLVLYAA